MAKMTLEQLRKLREEKKGEMVRREVEGKKIQIIVGMGTCGIAAGAKQTFDAIVKAVDETRLGDAGHHPADRLHGPLLRRADRRGGHARHAAP